MKKIIVMILALTALLVFSGERVNSKERNSFVTFKSVSSETLNPKLHEDTIEIGEVELFQIGDKKEVKFELENISNYDAVVEIKINGTKEFQNDYIKITTTDINEIKKHSTKTGTIISRKLTT